MEAEAQSNSAAVVNAVINKKQCLEKFTPGSQGMDLDSITPEQEAEILKKADLHQRNSYKL